VRPLPILTLTLASGCSPPPRPSVLWISLDTVRADHLALYGGRATTPHLEALAARALVFDQAVSQFPETQVSHWSMLTGTLPGVHGDVAGARDSAYTGPTAAELFAGAGYATAAFIGGVTLRAQDCGLQRGFSVYDDAFPLDPRDLRRPSGEVAARAAAWMEAQGDRPFFAFVHLFDAHFPYTPADPARYDPGYTGAFDGTDATLGPHRDFGQPLAAPDLAHVVALYDAEISEQDAALGPLLASAPEGAIVVVSADHGESFEHGYLFNHRAVLWDAVLRVPLVIRAPGLAPGRVRDQVGLSDALPTVLALAGVPSGAPFHGHAVAAPGAGPGPGGAVFATTDPYLPGALFAARTPAWKAVWDANADARAWDLSADPGETTPVAVPAALAGSPAAYRALLAAHAGWTRPQPRRPPDDPATGAALQALGYLDPADRPPTPPWIP